MALGAPPRDVLGFMVREGRLLPGIAAARFVAGMLVNVSATDPG